MPDDAAQYRRRRKDAAKVRTPAFKRAWAKYMREYQRRRYQTDPTFRAAKIKRVKMAAGVRQHAASLWMRQSGKCALCKSAMKRKTAQVDHKTPMIKMIRAGKTKEQANALSNLQLTCPDCNVAKGGR